MRGAESLEKAMGYVRKGPWETTAAAMPATVSGGWIVGRPGHCQDPPYGSLRFISLIAAGGLCLLFGSGRGPPPPPPPLQQEKPMSAGSSVVHLGFIHSLSHVDSGTGDR